MEIGRERACEGEQGAWGEVCVLSPTKYQGPMRVFTEGHRPLEYSHHSPLNREKGEKKGEENGSRLAAR